MSKINIKGKDVAIYTIDQHDYICITDIARYKDSERTDYIILKLHLKIQGIHCII